MELFPRVLLLRLRDDMSAILQEQDIKSLLALVLEIKHRDCAYLQLSVDHLVVEFIGVPVSCLIRENKTKGSL